MKFKLHYLMLKHHEYTKGEIVSEENLIITSKNTKLCKRTVNANHSQ